MILIKFKIKGKRKPRMQKIHSSSSSSRARFGGSCRSMCMAARFMMLTCWSHAGSKSENISTRCSSMKR